MANIFALIPRSKYDSINPNSQFHHLVIALQTEDIGSSEITGQTIPIGK